MSLQRWDQKQEITCAELTARRYQTVGRLEASRTWANDLIQSTASKQVQSVGRAFVPGCTGQSLCWLCHCMPLAYRIPAHSTVCICCISQDLPRLHLSYKSQTGKSPSRKTSYKESTQSHQLCLFLDRLMIYILRWRIVLCSLHKKSCLMSLNLNRTCGS